MRFAPIAVLLCLSSGCQYAKAFTPPIPNHHRLSTLGPLERQTLETTSIFNKIRARQSDPVQPLSALKKKQKVEDPSATLTKSEKVQEMAAFLAVQLLGVAMKEFTKEEGESKMNLEDLQKLTEALQGPLVETKQAQDKLATTWDAAGDAVDELLGDEGMTKLDPPTKTPKKEEPQKSLEEKPPAAVKPEDKKADKSETKATVAPTADSTKKAAVEEKASPKPKTAATETKVPPKAETKSLKSPDGVRIPEVISAEFGKALEVETSNVNPLRHPPKRDPNANTESKVESKATATQPEAPTEQASPKKDEPKLSSPAAASKPSSSNAPEPASDEKLATMKRKQELFQRNLLETRFKLESQSKAKQEETPSSRSTAAEPSKDSVTAEQSTSSSEEETNTENDDEPPTIEKSITPTAESQGESIELIRDFLSQPPSKPSPISIPKISESRLKSIIEARRQPKAYDEEASVAERYSKMSVEDRAFAILFDLGMIERNKDPKDPSYDHSDDDDYCEHLDLSS